MNNKLRRAIGAAAAALALSGSIAAIPSAASAATPAPAQAAPVGAARSDAENEAIVKAIYVAFLNRQPTAGELAAGKTRAAADQIGSIVSGVSRQSEWLQFFVSDLYDQALGRTPDSTGQAYWVNLLAQGRPTTLIAANVFGSSEFRTLAGNNDSGFVDRLYSRVLQRPADNAGKTHWLAQIARLGDANVAIEFFESVENRNRRVAEQYQELLCRAPDAAGQAYWADVIKGGKDVQLSEFLASSPEFINNAIAGRCVSTGPITPPPPGPRTFNCAAAPAGNRAATSNAPQSQCEALVAIYNATGGANWTGANKWLIDADPCTWEGIACGIARITTLDLNNRNVTGAIPAAIGGLVNVSLLDLGLNPITSLPTEVGALPLQTLNVSGTQITSLPSVFAAMPFLNAVNVANNNMSGGIGDITSNTNMSELQANNAGLATLNVSAMTNLDKLYIYNNPVATVGAKNTFTALPTGLAAMNGLSIFEAQFNRITSVAGVENHTGLTSLRLFNNNIASVPDGFTALTGATIQFGPQCGSPATASGGTATFMSGKDAGWNTSTACSH